MDSEERELLTPSEVAKMFRVDPKTVTRWARTGRLSSIRTLGGHRRYRSSEVRHLLHNGASDATQNDTQGGTHNSTQGATPEGMQSANDA